MPAYPTPSTIQARWFRLIGAFTLLLCLSYSGYSWLISWVTEDTLIENILSYEARQLQQNYLSENATASIAALKPSQHWLSLHTSPEQLPEVVKARLPSTRRHLEIAGPGRLHYHLHIFQLGSGTQAHSAYLLAEVSAILASAQVRQQTHWLLLLIALCMSLAALALAWYLTRHLVRPLQQITLALQNPVKPLPLNLPHTDRQDEIGVMARHLQTSLQQLQQSLQREREFTRDLSHELRTPLTLIQNELQLKTEFDPASLSKLRHSCNQIQHTLTVLLALARAESLQAQDFDLCAELELAILQQHQLQRQFSIELELPERFPLHSNQTLCRLFLQNCLENACHHGGAQTQLYLSLTPQGLLIRNTLKQASSTSPGFGHGQYLLQKIAATLHWQLRLTHNAEYYQVELSFNTTT